MKDKVGSTVWMVTAKEQRQLDAVRERLAAEGRIGAFGRLVLIRVILESVTSGCSLATALDRVAGLDESAA